MESEINPYKMLEVSRNFTLEQLRANYKKIAMRVHPEKIGNDYMFNLVTKCYKKLLKEHDSRQTKQEASDFGRDDNNELFPKIDPKEAMRHFNIDRFNQIFETNKAKDVTDAGYTEWMDHHQVKDAPVLQKGIDNNKLNSYFEKYADEVVDRSNKAMLKVKEPEPLLMCNKIAFTELGTENIDDFSDENKSLRSLNFMDYRVAHTTSRIVDPNLVKRQDYKSIEDVERDRANIKQFSSKELASIEKRKAAAEQQEKKKQEAQKQMDARTSEQFKKLTRLMLGGAMSKY